MTRAEKNLVFLNDKSDKMLVHKNYLYRLAQEEFASGMDTLNNVFKAMYIGMTENPHSYAMKAGDDAKGFMRNMNFLFQLVRNGSLEEGTIKVNGRVLAPALKEAKVTKPESVFRIYEPLGFKFTGLENKIEKSEISVEFPDDGKLLVALKAMAEAISMFSKSKPHHLINVYFETLDERVLKDYPAAEPKTTMEYIVSKLKGESREVVEAFYKFIEPFAKCSVSGSALWYWTPTFTLKSLKRVILSFKLDLENHDVKLNLANLGKYVYLIDGFPAKLKKEITNNGWECAGADCNPKCAGGFAFELDGKAYKKCRCGSFVFHSPDKGESELLLGLLKKELELCN